MLRVGYWAMLCYVFLSYSAAAQIVAPGYQFPAAIAGVAILMALFSGRFISVVRSRVGSGFLVLTAFFCISVPFGAYAMGSVDVLLNIWSKHLILFVVVAALATSRKGCSNLMMAIAVASSVACVGAILKGTEVEGRLVLGGTSLNDPNGLGLTGLFGLPLWMSVAYDRSRFVLIRMAAVLMTLPLIVAILMTGSRGSMVAAFLVGLYLLKRVSIGSKVTLIVAGSLALVLGGLLLSDSLLWRYQSLVSDEANVEGDSRDSRIQLAQQGLILFVQNPLLGVGIGQFAVAENDLALAQGMTRGSWHTVHNMYLEVLTEAGIFAFACFLWILVKTWQNLGQLERLQPADHPHARQIRLDAFWLRITLLLYCVAGLFLSIAVTQYFAVLTALPLALRSAVGAEMKVLSDEAATEDADASDRGPLMIAPEATVRGLRDGI